eukprot:jgi/Mesvir1/26980/Mv20693-RA.1
MKAFLVAGTFSGVGKTSIAVGLMAAFRRRGMRVQPFKVGPDFIDPMHHELAAGRPSWNLDGWMLEKDKVVSCFWQQVGSCDVAVIEGVMGLFDGQDAATDAGSSAQLAKWLDVPVVLVLDCSALSRSVAAVVKGFVEFDPKLRFAGLIFNKVGGPGHTAWLRDSVEKAGLTIPILGGVPNEAGVGVPERIPGNRILASHPQEIHGASISTSSSGLFRTGSYDGANSGGGSTNGGLNRPTVGWHSNRARTSTSRGAGPGGGAPSGARSPKAVQGGAEGGGAPPVGAVQPISSGGGGGARQVNYVESLADMVVRWLDLDLLLKSAAGGKVTMLASSRIALNHPRRARTFHNLYPGMERLERRSFGSATAPSVVPNGGALHTIRDQRMSCDGVESSSSLPVPDGGSRVRPRYADNGTLLPCDGLPSEPGAVPALPYDDPLNAADGALSDVGGSVNGGWSMHGSVGGWSMHGGSTGGSVSGGAPLVRFGSSNMGYAVSTSVSPRARIIIGIAHDEAFCFYYNENLSLLREHGAELVFFSPMYDEELPLGVTGLYFGGGYPELVAETLTGNVRMLASVKAFADAGGMVYGECGGLIYLSQAVETAEGVRYPMAGVLPFSVRMVASMTMGYIEVETLPSCNLFPPGQLVKGQLYHFCEITWDTHDSHMPPMGSAVGGACPPCGYADASRHRPVWGSRNSSELSLRGGRLRKDDSGGHVAAAGLELGFRVRPHCPGVEEVPPPMFEGFLKNMTLVTLAHLHWGSNSLLPQSLIQKCGMVACLDAVVRAAAAAAGASAVMPGTATLAAAAVTSANTAANSSHNINPAAATAASSDGIASNVASGGSSAAPSLRTSMDSWGTVASISAASMATEYDTGEDTAGGSIVTAWRRRSQEERDGKKVLAQVLTARPKEGPGPGGMPWSAPGGPGRGLRVETGAGEREDGEAGAAREGMSEGDGSQGKGNSYGPVGVNGVKVGSNGMPAVAHGRKLSNGSLNGYERWTGVSTGANGVATTTTGTGGAEDVIAPSHASSDDDRAPPDSEEEDPGRYYSVGSTASSLGTGTAPSISGSDILLGGARTLLQAAGSGGFGDESLQSPSLWPTFTFAAPEGVKVPGRFKRRESVGLTGSAAEEPMLARLHTLQEYERERRASEGGERPLADAIANNRYSPTANALSGDPERRGGEGDKAGGEHDLEVSRLGLVSRRLALPVDTATTPAGPAVAIHPPVSSSPAVRGSRGHAGEYERDYAAPLPGDATGFPRVASGAELPLPAGPGYLAGVATDEDEAMGMSRGLSFLSAREGMDGAEASFEADGGSWANATLSFPRGGGGSAARGLGGEDEPTVAVTLPSPGSSGALPELVAPSTSMRRYARLQRDFGGARRVILRSGERDNDDSDDEDADGGGKDTVDFSTPSREAYDLSSAGGATVGRIGGSGGGAATRTGPLTRVLSCPILDDAVLRAAMGVRICCLSAAASEILFALGKQTCLVAASTWCNFPSQGPKQLGLSPAGNPSVHSNRSPDGSFPPPRPSGGSGSTEASLSAGYGGASWPLVGDSVADQGDFGGRPAKLRINPSGLLPNVVILQERNCALDLSPSELIVALEEAKVETEVTVLVLPLPKRLADVLVYVRVMGRCANDPKAAATLMADLQARLRNVLTLVTSANAASAAAAATVAAGGSIAGGSVSLGSLGSDRAPRTSSLSSSTGSVSMQMPASAQASSVSAPGGIPLWPSPPRVVVLCALQPLTLAGFWVPEMVAMAGGISELQEAGRKGATIKWPVLLEYAPDVIVIVAPPNATPKRYVAEVKCLTKLRGFWDMPAVQKGQVFVCDHSCFCRPGLRLVDGVELLARILYPSCIQILPPLGSCWQLKPYSVRRNSGSQEMEKLFQAYR